MLRPLLCGAAALCLLGSHSALAQSGALLHHSAGSPYFQTPDGNAQFLMGNHTWPDNIQNWTVAGTFSWSSYINMLQAQGSNFVRYWMWAGVTDPNVNDHAGTGSPWPFTFSGGKWNLTSFNQAYFDKVAADVDAAKAKGIYVSVMLFFDYDPNGTYGWASSVWNGANNVNGTTTNNTAIEQSDPVALPLQKAYINKMLDTLANKTNVLYEVANEASHDTATLNWQKTIIDYVHTYQASHSYLAQPIGATSEWGSGVIANIEPELYTTNAEWVSPANTNSTYSSGDPPVATGAKVSMPDTDHIFGIGGSAVWPWQMFVRGHGGVLIMDDMHGTGLPGVWDLGPSFQAVETVERLSLKEIAAVTQIVNITTMRANNALASTGYALADATAGLFVVLAPGGGAFTVDLSAASGKTMQINWVNVTTGTVTPATTVSGGSSAQSFTSPSSSAVLVLNPVTVAPPLRNACFTVP